LKDWEDANAILETMSSAVGRDVCERWFCHGYDDDHDAVGTWWYVVELDREPLISASFEVRPSSD
jgi:hypothetical protein